MTTADLVLDSRYRLLRRLATGGMGEVWEGNDELLSRPVAVKLLRQEHVGDDHARARFRAEARYAAALQHSGIAQVYDYGEHDDLAYLVMELVSGESLSRILARDGALSVETTLNVVTQAARALQVAHSAGIIHRDIKPGNLMMTPAGVVKITDFGIARGLNTATLTQTGMVMGTAHYVSPEQASGQSITFATDLYSLGVVAFECLTGRPPFDAEQPVAIALKHVREAPPELPPDIPEAVRTLVRVLLSKDPQERPPSAQAVADEAFMIQEALAAGKPVKSSFASRSAADPAGQSAATAVHRFGDLFEDAFEDDDQYGGSGAAVTQRLEETSRPLPATARQYGPGRWRPGVAAWAELDDDETPDTLAGAKSVDSPMTVGSRATLTGAKAPVQRRTVLVVASVAAGVLLLGAIAVGTLTRGPASANLKETRDRVPSAVPGTSSLVPTQVPSPTTSPTSLPVWPGPRPTNDNSTASTTPTPSASPTGRPRTSPPANSPTPEEPTPTPSESSTPTSPPEENPPPDESTAGGEG